jgi:hypothetical protein
MNGWWKHGVSLGLVVLGSTLVAGDEVSQVSPPVVPPAFTRSEAATSQGVFLDRPVALPTRHTLEPVVVLERPVPAQPSCVNSKDPYPLHDPQVRPTGYRGNLTDPSIVARAKAADSTGPSLGNESPQGDYSGKMFSWQRPEELPGGPRLVPIPGPAGQPLPDVTPLPPGQGQVGFPEPPHFGFPAAPSLSPEGQYPGNQFYASAEALLWWLKGSSVPPLATTFPNGQAAPAGALGNPGTAILLGNTTMGDEARGGARVMLGYWFDDAHVVGVEAGGFVLPQRKKSMSATSFGLSNLAVPFIDATTGMENSLVIANPGVPGGIPAGRISLDQNTSFNGAEVNYRTNWIIGCNGFVDLLVGFRGAGLDEDLTFATERAGFIPGGERFTSDFFSTRNRFWGGQLGAVTEWRMCKWVFDLNAKVALGITQQTVNIGGMTMDLSPAVARVFPVGLAATPSNSVSFTRQGFTCIPEIGLTAGYQFTEHLRGFVGYNFLYWSQVARPGEQLDRMINPTQFPLANGMFPPPAGQARPAFFFNGSDFWAQGIQVGVEFRY